MAVRITILNFEVFTFDPSKFAQALQNNQRGDNYSLLTVLFALVLFLTAMSQRELAPWIRRVFLTLAFVVGAVGLVVMLTFPIRI